MKYNIKSKSKIQEFDILLALNREGNLSVGECARHMTYSGTRDYSRDSIATMRIKKLVEEGYIDKKIDPNNKRSRIISITEKGKDICSKL